MKTCLLTDFDIKISLLNILVANVTRPLSLNILMQIAKFEAYLAKDDNRKSRSHSFIAFNVVTIASSFS
jgi:hypothetical protein